MIGRPLTVEQLVEIVVGLCSASLRLVAHAGEIADPVHLFLDKEMGVIAAAADIALEEPEVESGLGRTFLEAHLSQGMHA